MKQLQAVAVILLCLSCEMGHSQPASLPDVGSKIWIGRYHEMEEYLRTADCDRIEVFKPSYAARCTFKPGGPIYSMAWRSPSPARIVVFTNPTRPRSPHMKWTSC